MSYNYEEKELHKLLGSVGKDVHIHRSVQFFNPQKISIGSNVRIDCFCVLSSGSEGITIGDHIHIGAASHLFGSGGKIALSDFCNISSRVSLFTSNDDYSMGYMTNPTVPNKFKNVLNGSIFLEKHVIIGCGSIILPNVHIHHGGAVGALSLVKNDVKSLNIVAGTPSRIVGKRNNKLTELEEKFYQNAKK